MKYNQSETPPSFRAETELRKWRLIDPTMSPSPIESDPQNGPQIARIPTLAYDLTYNREFPNALQRRNSPSGD